MSLFPGKEFVWSRASIIANAPNSSGVYVIWNKDRWIYVGETNDLQRRLLEHFDTAGTCILRNMPGGFGVELVSSQARVQRQNVLIGQLRPACNQMLG
jgi:excinuclease UvrABC nuclease subunit